MPDSCINAANFLICVYILIFIMLFDYLYIISINWLLICLHTNFCSSHACFSNLFATLLYTWEQGFMFVSKTMTNWQWIFHKPTSMLHWYAPLWKEMRKKSVFVRVGKNPSLRMSSWCPMVTVFILVNMTGAGTAHNLCSSHSFLVRFCTEGHTVHGHTAVGLQTSVLEILVWEAQL